MAVLKQYWRIIAFAFVCLASAGVGAWAYSSAGSISEQVQALDRLRNTVEGARRTAVNMNVIEARKQEIEKANAEFEESMNAALALQSYNAFLSEWGPDGKVVRRVERKPLIENVLPEPKSNADAISFRGAYETAFAALTRRLRARGKATPEEVKEYFERWDALREGTSGGEWRPWGPVTVGPAEEGDAPKNRTREEILRDYPRSRLAEEIARGINMYVDPGAFGKSDIADRTDVPTAIQIWQAQMSLWIQQDMAAALALCNEQRAEALRKAGRPDDAWVAHMPVKHLKKCSIDGKLGYGGGSNLSSFQASFTGVVNDEKRFVVPIALELIVEEAALVKIMEELCRVGFYTPTSVRYQMTPPSPIQDEFVYGEAPVLDVRIELEGYYFRQVFDPWIPNVIKEVLRFPDAKASKD